MECVDGACGHKVYPHCGTDLNFKSSLWAFTVHQPSVQASKSSSGTNAVVFQRAHDIAWPRQRWQSTMLKFSQAWHRKVYDIRVAGWLTGRRLRSDSFVKQNSLFEVWDVGRMLGLVSDSGEAGKDRLTSSRTEMRRLSREASRVKSKDLDRRSWRSIDEAFPTIFNAGPGSRMASTHSALKAVTHLREVWMLPWGRNQRPSRWYSQRDGKTFLAHLHF